MLNELTQMSLNELIWTSFHCNRIIFSSHQWNLNIQEISVQFLMVQDKKKNVASVFSMDIGLT